MPHSVKFASDCSICKFEKSKKCENCTLQESYFEKDVKKESIRGEAGVFTFKPMWYHDICEKSIYVTSKSQLKEECKKHDVLAARLM